MYKKLALILLSSFATSSFAYCPQSETKEVFEFNFHINPINFNYNYTANEITSMMNTNYANNDNIILNNSEYKALGLYKPKTDFSYSTSLKMLENNQNNIICVKPVMQLNLVLDPVIFIAKEATKFRCTKHRVEQHELLHHKFAVETIAKLKKHLNKNYAKFNRYYAYHPTQLQYEAERLKANISALLETIKKDSLTYYESEQNRFHKKIDTPENYKKESMYCSVNENIQISKLITEN